MYIEIQVMVGLVKGVHWNGTENEDGAFFVLTERVTKAIPQPSLGRRDNRIIDTFQTFCRILVRVDCLATIQPVIYLQPVTLLELLRRRTTALVLRTTLHAFL
jgi:hypothetical protein